MRLRGVDWLAEVLDCTVQSAYRLIREGIVPAVKLGRAVRVDEDMIREFVRNGGKAFAGGWRKESAPAENPAIERV